MALDFPNSPTVGQAFSSGGTIWTWDGVKWNGTATSPTAFVQKAGDTMTGDLNIAKASPAVSLNATGVDDFGALKWQNGGVQRWDIYAGGPEGGSNAGADLTFRRWNDAGAIIETPLTIARSTGQLTLTQPLNLPASDPTSANQAARKAYVDTKFKNVVLRVFTASTTWTPTTGMVFAILECVGSGGGGGGVAGGASQAFIAGGGGAGSYSRKRVTAAEVGAAQTVTINAAGNGGTAGAVNGTAGGSVSIGTLCVANGGAGGLFSSSGQFGQGGLGGAPGTGDIVGRGMPGQGGFYNTLNASTLVLAGGGASSIFGGGGQTTGGGGGTGFAASNYGAGGGGAATFDGNNYAGGNGSTGIAIITEFVA